MVAHTHQPVSLRIELEFKLLPPFCCSLKNKHLKINLSDLNKGNFITRKLINIKLLTQKLLKKQI